MHTRERIRKQGLAMDTRITIDVVTSRKDAAQVGQIIDDAMMAFYEVERACSRFDASSELMQLVARPGEEVVVSPLLLQTVSFACTIAELTDGRFDPTVGRRLQQLGFQRHYLTGTQLDTPEANVSDVSYRDIIVNKEASTITLAKPMVIDLGAVAKGFAIDLVAKQLVDFEGCIVDAGGDVYLSGHNEFDEPWRVGIQHPDDKGATIATLRLSDCAVCTSGDYERRSPIDKNAHHIVSPVNNSNQQQVRSATVVAPFAMMADALSTAAFVMGLPQGLQFLEECDVEGLLVSPDLSIEMTHQMRGYIDG